MSNISNAMVTAKGGNKAVVSRGSTNLLSHRASRATWVAVRLTLAAASA